MMLFLILYNVLLVLTIPERLDRLRFLDYDLDDDIADLSVLSKAIARRGVEVFKSFFESIVW